MSWLPDYSKRIKLTIDSDKVDSTLVDFPVLIKLSDSSGINSLDITSVFTELGSDVNRKKIAVTTSDSITQCYVEIEHWSDSLEKAELWVKVPTVVSGTTTDLYLYYDSTQSDNTSYIGDTGDTPAQNVWDNNFKLVMHMAQDPNGDVADAVKDSTSNINHGTPYGSMTSADLVDGEIGKAIEFDGSNDYLTHGTLLDVVPSALTFETLQKVTAKTGATQCILNKHNILIQERFYFFLTDANGAQFDYEAHDGGYTSVPFSTGWVLDVYDNRVITWDTANGIQLYTNGNGDGGSSGATALFLDGTLRDLCVGKALYENVAPYRGVIDEVRISNIARSDAWIKATYYSNWDELISFGAEEGFYISGYVKEGITPINRQIYAHNRDTGALVCSTTSSGVGGYFYCETTYSGAHYVVCLDDEFGASYNDLIYGNIYPVITSG